MHGLPRQLITDHRDSRPCLAGRHVQPCAVQRVGDVRNQFRHNRGAIAQIPLQSAVKTGMAEALQRPAHPPGHLAQSRDRGRRQVARIMQHPAGQVAQQPHVGGPINQSGDGRTLLASHIGQRHRDAQRRLGFGDPLRGQVLGLDFGFVERRIGDLQHSRDFAVSTGDHKVLVLLAAQ